MWGGVVDRAARRAWGDPIGRVGFRAIRAVQNLLLLHRCCRCCGMVTMATTVLNSGRCSTVVAVIVRVVVHTFYCVAAPPFPAPSSGSPSAPLPGAVVLFFKAVEAEEDFILLQLSHHHPLRLQINVVVNFPENPYLKNIQLLHHVRPQDHKSGFLARATFRCFIVFAAKLVCVDAGILASPISSVIFMQYHLHSVRNYQLSNKMIHHTLLSKFIFQNDIKV